MNIYGCAKERIHGRITGKTGTAEQRCKRTGAVVFFYLYDAYDEFKDNCDEWDMSEDYYKAAFKKKVLKEFYESMETVFRSGFGTESQTANGLFGGISKLLFGKKDDD